jgi:hypothetical protein
MIYCQMRDHKPLYRASLCMWKNSAAVHYVDIIWYNIIYVDNILSNMCWYVLGRFGGWTSITTRYFLSSDHGFPSSSQLPPSHRWSPPLPVGLGSNTEQKKTHGRVTMCIFYAAQTSERDCRWCLGEQNGFSLVVIGQVWSPGKIKHS